jgi:type I restriction enzyme, R subunit
MACCGSSSMTLHREIRFEDEICANLAAAGWLHAEGDAAGYDRARAVVPADLLAWMQATQPAAWAALAKNQGAAAEATLLDRLLKRLD